MKRLTLFSSFTPSDKKDLPQYIFYYLQQLRSHSIQLVFLYNEDFNLNEEDHKQLSLIVDDIMPVKNEGFDFGMWQKGLRKYSVDDYDELCLTNDSCICLNNLSDYFKIIDEASADMIGMTSSQAYTFHLQSYFLCIKRKGLKLLSDWILKQNFPQFNWEEVIIAGEFGINLFSAFKGLHILTMFPPNAELNIMAENQIPLIQHRVPFIKKKILLKDMQKHLPLSQDSTLLTEIIKHHYQLDASLCHQLFNWMPVYQLDNTLYEGK